MESAAVQSARHDPAAAVQGAALRTDALVVGRPGRIALRNVELRAPGRTDVVVRTVLTGISTGTEKLLFDGSMPPFPGLSYPLVPGYEAVGTVVEAGPDATLAPGTRVFVPGSSHYANGVAGLFGASAATLVTDEARVVAIDGLTDEQGVLLALAATAMHVFSVGPRRSGASAVSRADLAAEAPGLIVGHGVLGRLVARIALALGAPAPLVLDTDAARLAGGFGYETLHPDACTQRGPFARIVDVSGAGGDHVDRLIARLSRGGHLRLAGFYAEPIRFDFAPAFMREIVVDVAAQWVPDDLALTLALVRGGELSLDGLVSHRAPATDAATAYPDAFADGTRLKTVLDWT